MSILTPHQDAALDYSGHISLTANAGSGKTFVLSRRYLEIALNENVPLRNIAAITFTDKAAGELYRKISGEIDRLVTGSDDPIKIKKLERIRRQLVSANISTIHSFCIDILREYPVEAQLDANFIPLDQPSSDELIEIAIEDTIKELLNDPLKSSEIKPLIRMFSSRSKLISEISSLIKNRKNVLEAAAHYNNREIKEISEWFYNSFVKDAHTILFPFVISFIESLTIINNNVLDSKKNTGTAAQVSSIIEEVNKTVNIDEIIRLLTPLRSLICTGKGEIRVRGYLSREAGEGLVDEIAEAEDFLAMLENFTIPDNHIEIETELASAGKRILWFFSICLDKYEAAKKEGSWLDYEDLLLFTKKILENEQVQHSLSEKFRYIMIDEYQDTNELQYRIFLPILDYLKKNNLFVVGDEKQSIYMFRDAELEVFNKTKKDIIKTSGLASILTLPDSFRMAPLLCAFTNCIFRKLFASPDIMYNEVGHTDIVCARNEDVEGKVEILAPDKEKGISEAELISGRLLKLLTEEGQKYKWGDIAILCRKRKSFEELENAFVRNKIPFSIVGGKGFYQRQNIYDVFNYFSFLLDNGNDAALAGILRSPFFNISDAVLYRISLQKGYSFWQKLKKYTETDSTLCKAAELLEENRLLSGNYNLTFLLRKILNESGYNAVIASGINGDQESANMNKLIKLTTDFYSHGYKTLYDYVNFLKDAIDSEEDEAQAPVANEINSVKIMTIHQSKGLEFPVVVLYKCNEVSRNISVKTKEITVDKKYGLLTKVPLNNDYFMKYAAAPISGLSTFISRKKNIAEIKRLLYVAITRAKDILIISTEACDRGKHGSFTALLQEGLDHNLLTDININIELSLLTLKDSKYTNESKIVSMTIPVINEVETPAPAEIHDSQESDTGLIDLSEIKDIQKGEIISATKYSVFKQCPVKYNLIYEYGFSELFKHTRGDIPLDNKAEDDPDGESSINLKQYGPIKGTIIHRILQKEILPEDVESKGGLIIESEFKGLNLTANDTLSLRKTIIAELNAFYSSPIYHKLKLYKQSHNEYSIYLGEGDYFLYGIIDKLILDEDKGLIIDYKTDDIDEKDLTERSALYFNQLKFYSYIIKSAFKNIIEIKLQLIFLKYPGKDISIVLTPEEIEQTGEEIKKMASEIRQKKYFKNENHCPGCHFYLNNSVCIIK